MLTNQSYESFRKVRTAPYEPVLSITSARFEVFKLAQLLAMEAAIFCGAFKPNEIVSLNGETLLEVTFESFNFAMTALKINDKAINGRRGAELIAAPIAYLKFKPLVEFGVRKGLYKHSYEPVGHRRRHVKLLSSSRGIEGALRIDALIEVVMQTANEDELRLEAKLRPDLGRYVSILKHVHELNQESPGVRRAVTWP
jgi:hypothetical protein